MAISVGEVIATLKLRDEMSSALRLAEQNLGTFGAKAQRLGADMKQAGTAMTAGFTLPIVAGFATLVKSSADFQQAFANVRKTIGNVPELPQIREQIRALSREVPQSAAELAKMAALGGQFGISAKGIIEFTKTVAALDNAVDGMTWEQAAEGLAQLRNVTGESEADIGRLAAALVDLGNKGASSEQQILEFAQRLGGVGKQIGLTTGEIMGLGATFANLGINAEMGSTAIQRTLGQMQTAVFEGGEALQGFAKIAGQSADEFAQSFRQKPIEAITAFIDGLTQMKLNGENVIGALKALDVESQRQLQTLLQAAHASGNLANEQGKVAYNVRNATEAIREGTAHLDEAAEKNKTLWAELSRLRNVLADVLRPLGDSMVAALEKMIKASGPAIKLLEQMVKAFAALPGGVQLAVVATLAFAAALGPILYIGGNLVTVLGFMASGFGLVRLGALGASFGLEAYLLALSASHTAGLAGVAAAKLLAFAYGVELKAAAIAGALSLRGLEAALLALTTQWTVAGVAATKTLIAFYTVQIGVTNALTAATGVLSGALAWVSSTSLVMGARMAAQTAAMWLGVAATGALTAAQWLLAAAFVAVTRVMLPLLVGFAAFKATSWVMEWTGATDAVQRFWGWILRVPAAVTEANIAARRAAKEGIKELDHAFESLNDRIRAISATKSVADLQRIMVELGNAGELAPDVMRRVADEAQNLQRQGAKLTPELERIVEFYGEKMPGAARAAADSSVRLSAQLDDTKKIIASFTGEMKKEIAAGVELGKNNEEIAASLNAMQSTVNVTEAAVELYTGSLKANSKASKEAAKSAKEVAEALLAVAEAEAEVNKARGMTPTGIVVAPVLANDRDWRNERNLEGLRLMQEDARAMEDIAEAQREFNNWIEERRVEDHDRAAKAIIEQEKALRQIQNEIAEDWMKEEFERYKKTPEFAREQYERLLHDNRATVEEISEAWEAWYQRDLRRRHGLTLGWLSTLGSLASSFEQLAQIAEGCFSDTVRYIGTTIKAMEMAGQGVLSFDKGLAQIGDGKTLQGIQNLAAGAIQVASAFMQATSSGNKLKDTLGGAVVGAQVGMQVGGPIGAAIGAAIGGAAGLIRSVFNKPVYKDIMKRVGHEWGVTISEELAKAIEKNTKDVFKGNRQAAELFSLKDILDEAGGLSNANYSKMASKLRDVFVMLETGAFTAAQATQVLDENFTAFAEHALKNGGMLDAQMLDLIDLTRRFGLESKAVSDFLKGESTKVITGLSAVVTGTFGAWNKAQEAVKKGGEDLTDQQRRLVGEAQKGQAAFDRMGRLATVSFGAALISGKSLLETIREMGPALDELKAAAENFGFTTSAALSQLLKLNDFAKENEGLLAAVDGVNQMMQGLHNMGLMTQSTLNDLAATTVDLFNQLTAQGLTANEALALMQPTLQTLWRLSREFGFTLDENTAALVNQAEAAGIVGAHMKDTMEKVLDVLVAIADALGAQLPESVRKLSQAVGQAAPEMMQRFKDLEALAVGAPAHIQKAWQDFLRRHGQDLRMMQSENGMVWRAMTDEARAALSDLPTEFLINIGWNLGDMPEIPVPSYQGGWTPDNPPPGESVNPFDPGSGGGYAPPPGSSEPMPAPAPDPVTWEVPEWVNPFESYFHRGGVIKAHRGMFVKDPVLSAGEVPIVGLTGEGVLNRTATAMVGGEEGVDALNRGEGLGGDSFNLTFNVMTPDVSATERYLEDRFLPAFTTAIRRNRGGVRTALEKMLE